jgi:hypothetical protein
VDAAAGPQVCPERRARSLAGVTLDLASAIIIVIPRPCVHTRADSGMARRAATRAPPFIGLQPWTAGGPMFSEKVVAGPRVRMGAHPPAWLARLARAHTDDGGTSVGRGAVSLALIRTPAGRIGGVARGRAGVPPRVGRVHPPQTPCRSSQRSARYPSDGLEGAAVGYAAVCVTRPAGAPDVRSARPAQSGAATGPAWPAVAGLSRRRSLSAACHSPHRPDRERPESALEPGTRAARYCHTGGP